MLDRSINIALKAEKHIKSNHISPEACESKGGERAQTSSWRKWLKCCLSYRLYCGTVSLASAGEVFEQLGHSLQAPDRVELASANFKNSVITHKVTFFNTAGLSMHYGCLDVQQFILA